MEAMVDVKYRPVLFPNGGAAAAAAEAKKLWPAAGGESVYRECLKNHAASLGGHAVDGCGEFMPSPAANPSDPTSLKCAACGCHRNFHRRLPETPPSPPRLALPPPAVAAAVSAPHLMHGGHPQRGEETPEDRLPAAGEDDSEDSDEGSDYYDDRPASTMPALAVAPPGYMISSATHMLLSLSAGAPGSAPAVVASRSPASVPGAPSAASAARKRFRTKFSPEQKQRMQALSERLGWRLQKRDEAVVDECCREIGVGKGVFKVWMHNNKHNFLGGHSARRNASTGAALHTSTHLTPPPAPAAASAPPVHADFNINGSSISAVAAADRPVFQPATVSGGSGSPQSS